MEKEQIGKTVTNFADGVVLALDAQGATDFVDGNRKKQQNKRTRNGVDGNNTKNKRMMNVFQIGNDVTSTSRGIEKYQCMKEPAEQEKKRKRHKRSIENYPPKEPPSIQERNGSAATTHDIESGSHSSSSFDEVLGSWVRRKKTRKHKERDDSVERNKETEKFKGTEFLIRSTSKKDFLLQLQVNSCLKEDSEVNCNALDVCLSMDRNDAGKQCKKHVQDPEAMCSTPCLNAKSSIENDSKTEPPSNNFIPERNASVVPTHDIVSGIHSTSSFNEVLSSPIRRQKSRKWEKRENSVERNEETESKGTKFLSCGSLEKDILLELPVNSCLKEDSEVNCYALDVCQSSDMSEAEKQREKHDLAESIRMPQDHEAICSRPCSNADNICSAAESNWKPVSKINSISISFVETHDDHAELANSTETKSINNYSRESKIVPDPPAVNSESIPDTRSLLPVPNREDASLVQSVEAPLSFCSKHVHEKEFDDAADMRSPPFLELCAFRDEIAENTNMELLSQEGSFLRSSRKKLLVLDINGLLADVVYEVLEGYTPEAIISGRSVFKRPFCDDFLEFCLARFNVGVWSSRMKRNVESILDFLMGKTKHKLLFCWDQSHCTDSYRTTVEDRKKPLLVKKLKKLWEKYEPGLPWELGEYNESNTLLLDDSPYKALCNPPYTAVFPTTYRYMDKEDNSLGPGGELRMYLEGLAMAENVQKYVKENPIGKRPITEKNPSWRFYLDVIRACSSPENSPIRPTFYW